MIPVSAELPSQRFGACRGACTPSACALDAPQTRAQLGRPCIAVDATSTVADLPVDHAPPNPELLRQAREWFGKALKVDPQLAVAKEFARMVRSLTGGALIKVPSRRHQTTSSSYLSLLLPQMMINILSSLRAQSA